MAIHHLLDLVNFGLVILIWLVQLIIYPSLAHVDDSEFIGWHRRYVRRITILVGPLMTAQMLLLLWAVRRELIPANVLMLGGAAVIWLSSAVYSVPCHLKLQQTGRDRRVIHRLVRTNWIRTILWSAVFVTGLARG